jgi:hypothetical protein
MGCFRRREGIRFFLRFRFRLFLRGVVVLLYRGRNGGCPLLLLLPRFQINGCPTPHLMKLIPTKSGNVACLGRDQRSMMPIGVYRNHLEMLHLRSKKALKRFQNVIVFVEVNRVVIGFQQNFIGAVEPSENVVGLPIVNKDGSKCLEFVDGLATNAQERQIMEDIVAAIGMIGDRRHGEGCNDYSTIIRYQFFKCFLIANMTH